MWNYSIQNMLQAALLNRVLCVQEQSCDLAMLIEQEASRSLKQYSLALTKVFKSKMGHHSSKNWYGHLPNVIVENIATHFFNIHSMIRHEEFEMQRLQPNCDTTDSSTANEFEILTWKEKDSELDKPAILSERMEELQLQLKIEELRAEQERLKYNTEVQRTEQERVKGDAAIACAVQERLKAEEKTKQIMALEETKKILAVEETKKHEAMARRAEVELLSQQKAKPLTSKDIQKIQGELSERENT